jgi:TonB family protein
VLIFKLQIKKRFEIWLALLLTLIFIGFTIYYLGFTNYKLQITDYDLRGQNSEVGGQKPEATTVNSEQRTASSEKSVMPDYRISDAEQNKISQTLPEIKNPPPEINDEDDKVFTVVEQNPAYPGGESARMNFLRRNIRYPAKAISKKTEGKVIINFIVEKDGTVSKINVLKGIGNGCDEEALRVAKMMPKWKPGLQSGLPVRVSFNMPINFQLRTKN